MVMISLLFIGCNSSKNERSKKEAAVNLEMNSAFQYYNQLNLMIGEVANKVEEFKRALRAKERFEIEEKLEEVQTCATENADKISKLGGYQGDTELDNAYLELLEFYESLYTEDYPPLLDYWLRNDTKGVKVLLADVNARMKNELPGLEQKVILAKYTFFKKYNLPLPAGQRSGDKLNRQLDYLETHGTKRDRDRARRVREQLKEFKVKKKR
jgi:hypothetical protein